jgi:hypothetical protein
VTVGIESTGYTLWFHALLQRWNTSRVSVFRTATCCLRVCRSQANQDHELGLLLSGVVMLGSAEPISNAGPFS